MNDFPKIWLLRHGETYWNAERRVQGQLESDLTPRGRGHAEAQAILMAEILKAHDPDCLVSPLRRAQDTARIALAGRPFETDPRLAEVHAGIFQGHTWDEIRQSHSALVGPNPRALDLFCAAPGGEGYEAFHQRIQAVLTELTRPTVIVAHGLLGQVLRGIVCGLEHDELAVLPNEQGCVYLLENGEEQVLRV